MKAIVVHEFGGPEVLKLEEVPTPKPAAGQVLVRVHAIGVNPYDTYMRAGTYALKPPLPYTPGSDAARGRKFEVPRLFDSDADFERAKQVRGQLDLCSQSRTKGGPYPEFQGLVDKACEHRNART